MVLSSVAAALGRTRANIVKAATYTGGVVKSTSGSVGHQAARAFHGAETQAARAALATKNALFTAGRHTYHAAQSTKSTAQKHPVIAASLLVGTTVAAVAIWAAKHRHLFT